MKCRRLRAEEIIKMAGYTWATTEDVKMLACVGNNQALEIKKIIKEKQGNIYSPTNQVSMKVLIEYLGIDIEYLKNTIIGGNVNG